MDKELKAKWVAALRGGEFTQTDGLLHDSSKNAYCCLGVLGCVATGKFAEEACYGEYEPYEAVGNHKGVLVDMNDHGNSFSEIADFIEANL